MENFLAHSNKSDDFLLTPDEIADATANYLCPSREYDNAISQRTVAKVLSHFEPVELEALGDEGIHKLTDHWNPLPSRLEGIAPEKIKHGLFKTVSQATIQHNQKGQLYRIREGK